MSQQHFEHYIKENNTPKDAVAWLHDEFAYNVVDDIEAKTDRYLGPDFNFWKLYMSDEKYNGKNDFSDEELRYIINKAHAHGKQVDVHCGPSNAGLRRMFDFDIDTLEHPFYGHFVVDTDIIRRYVEKGVMMNYLLRVKEYAELNTQQSPTYLTRRYSLCRWSPRSTAF